MVFPVKHTEEENLLAKKYTELKRKKKLLQQQRQNKNKPPPEVKPVKRPVQEPPPSQEDAKEMAKKVWAAKQAELVKQNRGTGFKRSSNLERKLRVPDKPEKALPSFQPFSPGGTAGGPGPGGNEEPVSSPGVEGGRKPPPKGLKGLYNSFVSSGRLDDQNPGRRDSESKDHSFDRRDRGGRRGNTIYVHAYGITHEICDKAFSQFGAVSNISVEREKGCAFVTFDKVESADEAVKQVDGNMVSGLKLKVSMARRQPMLESAADTTSPWGSLAAGITRGRHKDKRDMVIYEDPFAS
ncbi:negative elongation factor E-like [Amphiura filiformis]|uniref:negative elongation factor E-like n=1 Tax=Amphiura filiformis TaxID=82378 RepID=UPI003B20DB05